MSPFLQLALALAIILTAAKLAGYVSYRLGQPSVLGELIAGLIIGPSVLDIFHQPIFEGGHVVGTVSELAEFGVLLLMFIAGLELHLSDLARSGKVSALAGTLGVIMPVAMGFGVARAFGIDQQAALFVGLILAATSVSISAGRALKRTWLSVVFNVVFGRSRASQISAFVHPAGSLSVPSHVWFETFQNRRTRR